MRESALESYFRDEIVERGGWSIKLVSVAGIPDRLVMMPGGEVIFVELKTDNGRLSNIQKAVHRKLSRLGCHVETLWGKSGVDSWLINY